MSRRSVLQFLGLGAGVAAVAGATGLTWQAIGGGVFASGTGNAYAAWDQAAAVGTKWRTEWRASLQRTRSRPIAADGAAAGFRSLQGRTITESFSALPG